MFSNLLAGASAGLRESKGFWFNSWLVAGELLNGATGKAILSFIPFVFQPFDTSILPGWRLSASDSLLIKDVCLMCIVLQVPPPQQSLLSE